MPEAALQLVEGGDPRVEILRGVEQLLLVVDPLQGGWRKKVRSSRRATSSGPKSRPSVGLSSWMAPTTDVPSTRDTGRVRAWRTVKPGSGAVDDGRLGSFRKRGAPERAASPTMECSDDTSIWRSWTSVPAASHTRWPSALVTKTPRSARSGAG